MLEITKDELIGLYITQGLMAKEIAPIYGFTVNKVESLLRTYDVRRRKGNEKKECKPVTTVLRGPAEHISQSFLSIAL